jgi:hypothetical protein
MRLTNVATMFQIFTPHTRGVTLVARAGTLSLLLCASGVARALADIDDQCAYLTHAADSEMRQCARAAGTQDISNPACVSAHRSELVRAGSLCISGAEQHYEAAAGLSGYEADQELMSAARLEMYAISNNALVDQHLAVSQLKSVISLLSRVRNDPNAGDLAPVAESMLGAAKSMLALVPASQR